MRGYRFPFIQGEYKSVKTRIFAYFMLYYLFLNYMIAEISNVRIYMLQTLDVLNFLRFTCVKYAKLRVFADRYFPV